MVPIFSPLRLVIGLWLWMAASAFAQLTIIDTRFDQIQVNERQPDPVGLEVLPLKAPTQISVKEPSTVVVGQETIGGLKSPYAVVKAEGLVDKPESVASINFAWDLREVPLERGRYELAFQFAALNAEGSAGRVRIVLLTDDNKSLQGHSASLPPVVSFAGNRIFASKFPRPLPINPGESRQVVITLDTEKLTWGVSIDGEVVRPEEAFEPEYLDQLQGDFKIGRVEYTVTGGLGDGPGAEFALANVVFKKL